MHMRNDSSAQELIPIKAHTPKSFIAAVILGVFIGLAIIVPGISGSTIAIIFGLYTGMLYALGNILGDFRRCFAFLLPIGIGAAVGFVAGFLAIQRVFEAFLFELLCLFAGLMIGAVPAITREIKGEKIRPLRVLLFAIGVAIPLAISALSIALSGNVGEETGKAFSDFPLWRYFAYFPLGFVVSVTQIVPGLSATAILMAFGQFGPILESLHADYIIENPQVIVLLGSLALGFAAGIISISKVFSIILQKHKTTAFFMIVGLSFGSIASMFLNSDVWTLYGVWASSGINVPSLVIGLVLLVLGSLGSFLLAKYELSHHK